MRPEPSPADVKAAFLRSNLRLRGYTFEAAMARPLLRLSLTITARARLAPAPGVPAPRQLPLRKRAAPAFRFEIVDVID